MQSMGNANTIQEELNYVSNKESKVRKLRQNNIS